MHKYIIRNSGQEDAVLNFDDGTSVSLKPNEFFSYEGDGEIVMPRLEPNQRMWIASLNFGELESSPSEEVTIVGSNRYWNVTIPAFEPIVPGSWKKEGF
jgi:hypothetical protein